MMANRIAEGVVVDGFTVVEHLHKGGMSTLWKVTHPDHAKPLLMKVPFIGEGEDPAAIVSFEMEQMILPRLKGPHVPKCHATGVYDVQPYIVMELMQGKTLLPMLDHLPMAIDELASWGAGIADALDALHRQRVVHLDLKPSNIMRRDTGEVVLIDYGLARHLDLPDLMSEEFRLPYGTAPYMAPEQVLGERSDVRSDQFALGSLLYFFSTGERPFGDPQRLKGLKKRIWWDPPPPSALRKDMPPWFQEIVLRCLEVNARQRYPTAAQLAFDLRHPQQVQLTKRARKDKQSPWLERLGRSMQQLEDYVDHPGNTTAGLADAPIVMVAIDVSTTDDKLQQGLRDAVSRVLEHGKSARLACVNVLKLSRIALDSANDEDGKNRHLQRIVELKDWARNLGLEESRISYHVLEATDPADTILEYARHNGVDHIVMGARANSTMRRLLGSVSGKVAAEAPCSVTVVRERSTMEE